MAVKQQIEGVSPEVLENRSAATAHPSQGVPDEMTHQHDSENALGHSKSGNLSFATDTETPKDSKNCVGQAPSNFGDDIGPLTLSVKHPYWNF